MTMKSFTLFALVAAALVALAQARPTEHDDVELIEFALSHDGGDTYILPAIGKLFEKYGKKLAIVGRIIAGIGDAMTGFGRWLQRKEPMPQYNGGIRFVLLEAAQELAQTKSSMHEEQLSSILVAAAFADVAEETVADDAVEARLIERLHEIATRLVELGESRGPVEVDAIESEVTVNILEKLANEL